MLAKNALLLIIAITPVIFICLYIYHKDKNKEPKQLLSVLFLKGIFSCGLVLIISRILKIIFPFVTKDVNIMNTFEVFFYSFIYVALVEESCKWYFVYKYGYKSRMFDERYDIIVYSVFVSLGFAFFENLFYVFGYNSIQVAITRGLLSVPGHACNSIFMGYYLTLTKQYSIIKNKKKAKENKIKSIVIPTILHGIYDFCIFINNDIFSLIFVIYIIVLYIITINKINKISKKNVRLDKITMKPKFCSNCGSRLTNGSYCSKCGKKN